MGKQEEIREALAAWARKHGPDATVLATVKSVDEDAMTCVLEDDEGLEIHDVRLRPVLDGNQSITIFPKVDTWALAIRIESDEEWMLLSAGEIDKWQLVIGDTIIEQNEDGLLIQKGSDSLKEVLTNIIEAVQQIVVLYGNNPDYAKLATALTKTNNIFR